MPTSERVAFVALFHCKLVVLLIAHLFQFLSKHGTGPVTSLPYLTPLHDRLRLLRKLHLDSLAYSRQCHPAESSPNWLLSLDLKEDYPQQRPSFYLTSANLFQFWIIFDPSVYTLLQLTWRSRCREVDLGKEAKVWFHSTQSWLKLKLTSRSKLSKYSHWFTARSVKSVSHSSSLANPCAGRAKLYKRSKKSLKHLWYSYLVHFQSQLHHHGSAISFSSTWRLLRHWVNFMQKSSPNSGYGISVASSCSHSSIIGLLRGLWITVIIDWIFHERYVFMPESKKHCTSILVSDLVLKLDKISRVVSILHLENVELRVKLKDSSQTVREKSLSS